MSLTRRFVSPTALVLTLVGAAGFGCSEATDTEGVGQDEAQLGIGGQCGGARCDSVARGKNAFMDGRLKGLESNGRACGDCHMPTDSFQLSPANVQSRWAHAQQSNADDPLFRPIDADDFRTNGQNASNFTTLREMALVRVTINLADPTVGNTNAEVFDPDTNTWIKTADVWRAVPSIMDVKLTGSDGQNAWATSNTPNKTGGYQLDARAATLQAQARGAFFGHAEVQSEPSQEMLDDIAAFENTVFSSDRTRALAAAIDNHESPLPSADPPLNEQEARGKVVFDRACAFCHGGNGQSTTNTPPVIARFHDISTACPRPADTMNPPRWQYDPCPPQVANKIRTYRFTQGSTVVTRASSDPGRALLAGAVVGGNLPNGMPRPPAADDWQKMDVPTLRNLKNTAPYFHNNSAPDIAAVLRHYDAFAKRVFFVGPRPGGKLPPVISTNGVDFDRTVKENEREDVTAYLLTL